MLGKNLICGVWDDENDAYKYASEQRYVNAETLDEVFDNWRPWRELHGELPKRKEVNLDKVLNKIAEEFKQRGIDGKLRETKKTVSGK